MLVYNIEDKYTLLKEDSEKFSLPKEIKKNNTRKNYLQMDKIMKKLFTLHNTRPIIDFLNAIYGDNISYDAKLYYENTEINSANRNKYITFYADMYITVKDNDRILEYALEFQTVFANDMAIRIFRYSFERAVKLSDYTKDKNSIEITLPDSYLIVLEEEKDLQDYITLKINIPKENSFTYKIKTLRYWTYDLENLYEQNMYLLYPLQMFKFRKTMENINNSSNHKDLKKVEMLSMYNQIKETIYNTLKAIENAYYDGKIDIEDFNEMNIVINNLNSYFLDMYGKYGNIEEEVSDMVKSFYDPKVEARGIEKGIEKGIIKGEEKEREKIKNENMITVEKLLIKKFGEVNEYIKTKINKATNDKLRAVIENILDIEKIEEVVNYLE